MHYSLVALGFMKKEASIKDHIDYLKYVLEHKYRIYEPMRDLNLSRWQALTHDLNKLRPSQWNPYVDYWDPDPDPPSEVLAFNKARRRHFEASPHHWHLLPNKSQDLKYQLEAVADWYASAKTQRPKEIGSFKNWYEENKDNLTIKPNAREIVERTLYAG